MADSTASLRELLERIARENDFSNYEYKLEPISSGGANYSSELYSVMISDEQKHLNLFAKVIIISEKICPKDIEHLFQIEPFVYLELSKIYFQLEDKYKVPSEHRLEFTKFYGHNPTRGQEVLVLEDLTAQGYSAYNRFISVEGPYAFKAFEEIAKLHALSFAFEEKHPEEYEKSLHYFVANPFENNEQVKGVMMAAVETALLVVEKSNKSRLEDFISKSNIIEDFMEYLKPLRRTVLMHGDFRVSNLMHKVDHEGNYKIKIIDYQTIRTGTPVTDLLYFIFTGTDEEFRAKHYLPLLDHYYFHLTLAMQRLGLKPDEIYSRDDFETELKMKLPFGLLIGMFLLPVVMVDEDHAPIVNKDSDMSVFKIQKVGKLYPERINGILNDFIKWKIL